MYFKSPVLVGLAQRHVNMLMVTLVTNNAVVINHRPVVHFLQFHTSILKFR